MFCAVRCVCHYCLLLSVMLLITRLMLFNTLCMFVFLVCMFSFLFCVFCVFVLFCASFLLLYIAVSFLFFIPVYRSLPPGGIPTAVNKYRIIMLQYTGCYMLNCVHSLVRIIMTELQCEERRM